MNVSVQIAKIADAKGCPPGHVNYLKKDEMSEIAERVLPEVLRLQQQRQALLIECEKALEELSSFGSHPTLLKQLIKECRNE